MEQKIIEENIKNNLVFCIHPRKAFAIKSIPRSVFEIRYIRTKLVYFLFRLNFDFCFFIKPWRNRLSIWIISQERVDLDCITSGSPPFKLTTVERSDDLSNNSQTKRMVISFFSFSHKLFYPSTTVFESYLYCYLQTLQIWISLKFFYLAIGANLFNLVNLWTIMVIYTINPFPNKSWFLRVCSKQGNFS